jgi:cysteine desulfurase/selenocysteine lyase
MDYSQQFVAPKGTTYFDSAATSLTASSVLAKMDEYYYQYRANIHRGEHRLTRRASEEYEQVYVTLSKFFNARDSEFSAVRNTTEAINYVARGLDFKVGDEVVVTDIEHHSNLLPWLRLAKNGVIVKVLEADEQGKLSAEKLSRIMTGRTKLVAFSACSNVLGTAEPVEQLAKVAKDSGALVLLDAAQHVGHHPVDLRRLPVDYLAFSGHKCFGPTGIGVLYHREGAPLEPLLLGGGTVREATLTDYRLLDNRERFEAGTPAIAEWIGLGQAIKVIEEIRYANIEAWDAQLAKKMLQVFEGLSGKGVQLYGPKTPEDKGCALFSFNVKGVDHHQTAMMLDRYGFACRSGHHCAMPLTKKLGVKGTVRASLHIYNSLTQVEGFGDALSKIAAISS